MKKVLYRKVLSYCDVNDMDTFVHLKMGFTVDVWCRINSYTYREGR